MKKISFLSPLLLLFIYSCNTGGKAKGSQTYKAKLEVKALCMNYTLRVVEGDIDTSLVVGSYTDESTGKSYQKAFGLSNPCDFPASINEGDEFYFKIDTAREKNCAVCMAYYPTPSRKLLIKVIEK